MPVQAIHRGASQSSQRVAETASYVYLPLANKPQERSSPEFSRSLCGALCPHAPVAPAAPAAPPAAFFAAAAAAFFFAAAAFFRVALLEAAPPPAWHLQRPCIRPNRLRMRTDTSP